MQIASFNLNNSSAAVVAFDPMVKDGLLASYANTTPTTASLYPQVSCAMRPAKGSVPRKTTIKVVLPFTHTSDNGVVTTEQNSVFIDVIINSKSDSLTANDILTMASGALQEPQFVETAVKGAFPY